MPIPDATYPCSHNSFQEVNQPVRNPAMTASTHIPQPNALRDRVRESAQRAPRYVDLTGTSLAPRLPGALIGRQADYQSLRIPGAKNIPRRGVRGWEAFSAAKGLETLWFKVEATSETERGTQDALREYFYNLHKSVI
ncbi:cysteine synthase [Colletotrichum sojae]|uniref:Cysteine synthase n=1 Tax=Colletotrichum sojae TaxID=2175907 RepID=A0A8H6JCH7_9PEZI|nr:cysteine synthase [Colletotrichum sojae]